VTSLFRILGVGCALVGLTQGQAAREITDRKLDRAVVGRFYSVPATPAPHLNNSGRLKALTRNGKLYLSLQDAIALALENNLDIELERYDVRVSETDILRAQAGEFPRGVPLSIREGPSGVGLPSLNASTTGPATLGGGDIPALNGVVGAGTQTDLSILGSIPLSTGPDVPNLDPTLSGTLRWNKTSEPQNSTFLPGLRSLNANTVEADVAVRKGFVTGTTATIGWNNLRQDVNSPLLNYNPYTTSSLYVSVNQPLLRGLGIAVNTRYIRITRNNRQISNLVFEQQLMSTVSAVVQLYWDLVSLKGDLAVRNEALRAARQLLADNQTAAAEGTMAAIDVTRARAEVARRQRDWSVSQTLVHQQSEILKDYLTRNSVDEETVTLELTDQVQVPAEETLPPVRQLAVQALRNRPDLAQARLQLTNSQIALKGSHSALLPALNAFASAENRGLAGDPNDLAGSAVLTGTPGLTAVRDPLFVGGYGDSLSQIVHQNFPNYEAGLQLTIPLANRAARADAARDQLQTRQQEIRLRQLEKRTLLEITNATLAIEQARASYRAAREQRVSQEEAVRAEHEKQAVGDSTTYLVMQYEGELAEAKSAEISAGNDYMKAKTALERALGSILTDNGVSLPEALIGESH